jgi:hypothetical protein
MYIPATEYPRRAVLADVMSGTAKVLLTQDQGVNVTDICQVKEENESALHNPCKLPQLNGIKEQRSPT